MAKRVFPFAAFFSHFLTFISFKVLIRIRWQNDRKAEGFISFKVLRREVSGIANSENEFFPFAALNRKFCPNLSSKGVRRCLGRLAT